MVRMTDLCECRLSLKSDLRVLLQARDDYSCRFLQQLGRIFQLDNGGSFLNPIPITLELIKDSTLWPSMDPAVCYLLPVPGESEFYQHATEVSMAILRRLHGHRAMFLHGALAERDGRGIVLAAAGGTGKSTASRRLPSPWKSLCDDTTLIVQDKGGSFWAHPWPTWSRFQTDIPDETWDVQSSIPLGGIYFLARSTEDRCKKLRAGEGSARIVESAEQICRQMGRNRSKELARQWRMERIEMSCAMAAVLPLFELELTLTGRFWEHL